jgi:hypothetical protein
MDHSPLHVVVAWRTRRRRVEVEHLTFVSMSGSRNETLTPLMVTASAMVTCFLIKLIISDRQALITSRDFATNMPNDPTIPIRRKAAEN